MSDSKYLNCAFHRNNTRGDVEVTFVGGGFVFHWHLTRPRHSVQRKMGVFSALSDKFCISEKELLDISGIQENLRAEDKRNRGHG
ncbi:hypothetical protein [Halocynthiibacter namhaensis]|uniref:hypothetical protein n=1 Tax=Halocynthiibacter namhaensis TaxID=1290553 RepID=UPI0012E09717|nr:hypothetical protein [Halocynthiibacter namhaensis]